MFIKVTHKMHDITVYVSQVPHLTQKQVGWGRRRMRLLTVFTVFFLLKLLLITFFFRRLILTLKGAKDEVKQEGRATS